MSTQYFVKEGSIVRRIWGSTDTVLFIFAGAAAEFALNKAVDWLYFTGKLPADPLGRLFSTVGYAKSIIFAKEADALSAIDKITSIHKGVENSRGTAIPDWAYRDVLYMLTDYTIRAFSLLERKPTRAEKEDVYDVFYRMGTRMGLKSLPASYAQWLPERQQHMTDDLLISKYTSDLFAQYKKHLRPVRYSIMLRVQALLVPEHVKSLLGLKSSGAFRMLLAGYRLARMAKIDKLIEPLFLPLYVNKL